jgi:hypothetical protein
MCFGGGVNDIFCTIQGEKENGPFQFTFNGFLKVAFQGSRVTSDAGLILIRELDERLGLEKLIPDHLSDSRHGTNTQFRWVVWRRFHAGAAVS